MKLFFFYNIESNIIYAEDSLKNTWEFK